MAARACASAMAARSSVKVATCVPSQLGELVGAGVGSFVGKAVGGAVGLVVGYLLGAFVGFVGAVAGASLDDPADAEIPSHRLLARAEISHNLSPSWASSHRQEPARSPIFRHTSHGGHVTLM